MRNPNLWKRLQILGTFPQSFAGERLEKYYSFEFPHLTFVASK